MDRKNFDKKTTWSHDWSFNCFNRRISLCSQSFFLISLRSSNCFNRRIYLMLFFCVSWVITQIQFKLCLVTFLRNSIFFNKLKLYINKTMLFLKHIFNSKKQNSQIHLLFQLLHYYLIQHENGVMQMQRRKFRNFSNLKNHEYNQITKKKKEQWNHLR